MPTPPDPKRVFERTTCACDLCRVPCRHMPGCLIPGELEEIAKHQGVDLETPEGEHWVQDHFRASNGARVYHPASRLMMDVPTIVPAQQPNGRCVFLTDEDSCSIHEVAPFGCSYHDLHLGKDEADRRSDLCVQVQLHDALNVGDHTNRWMTMLASLGLTAPSLVFRRDRFLAELKEVEDGQKQEADAKS